MCRIKIPGCGKIHVYNVHLCAFCDSFGRLLQAYELLDFIDDMESLIWGKNPVILGGDFNIADERVGTDALEYGVIVGAGFSDTYAISHNDDGICMDGVCCDPETGVGCTFAVSEDNPYAINQFTGLPEEAVRIDYIFEQGFEEEDILESTVIFNPPWVSDHSAVLTRFAVD